MSVGAVNKSTGDRIPTAGMPAIDDALDLTSVNPVQNAVITAALANKQDKTDNSLQTTDKTVVGAVNELKSGLTNYENQNNLNLEVPNRKNILPMTINYLKSINGVGTWSGNVYSRNGINFTVQTDAKNNVTGIAVSGTATANSFFVLYKNDAGISQFVGCVLNGVQSGDGIGGTYGIGFEAVGAVQYNGNDYTIPSLYSSKTEIYIRVSNGVQLDTVIYPMIRPATITDATFAPYIPSVESRIEAVESNLSGVFTADLLYEGAPTTAETYEEMNLISGKSITDYLLILFICRQYNNTVAFAIEPRHVFTQQTGDGSRVIFKYGDGALQTVMVYYVSPTKIAVNQKTVDGAIWKTALYGIIKQP